MCLGQHLRATARIACLALLLLGAGASFADEPVSFKGKTVTVIVGSPAGGGTDSSARLIASLIANHLPGKPALIVRNIPGAEGITSMNYFAKQVAADGLTFIMGSTTQADPLLYRRPQAQFDPATFPIVGGIGRGGTVLLMRKEAERRLVDKNTAPVIMGALGGVPRSGMVMTAWGVAYLDWNAKWVLGYRGTNDLMVALERGEIDMTTTGNLFQIRKFLEGDKFKIFSQSGSLQHGRHVPRPDFGEAPVFAQLIEGRITGSVEQKAFDYWSSLTSLDKWLALPPKSPPAFLRAYRRAYLATTAVPEFGELGRKISEDLEPMGYEDVELLIQKLGATPPEAVAAIGAMLRRQGIPAD